MIRKEAYYKITTQSLLPLTTTLDLSECVVAEVGLSYCMYWSKMFGSSWEDIILQTNTNSMR